MAQPVTRYTLNTAINEYDIGFDVTNAEGFDVYIEGDQKDINIDYTVIGTTEELRDAEGKVNLTVGFNNGDIMVVLRRTEEERVTNFEQAARFEEKELDAEFDNFLRLIEDALLYLTATPNFAPEDIGTINGQLPAKIPGGVIRLNEQGDGFEYIRVEDFPEFAEAIQKCIDEADRAEQEANNSETSSQAAQAARVAAEQARDFASKWASAPEDEEVDDGVNPPGFSAFHWAQKTFQALFDTVKKIAGATGTSDNGAIVVPLGTEVQRPTDDLAMLRARSEDGDAEYRNPLTDEWGPVGGGGTPKKIPVSENTLAARNKFYAFSTPVETVHILTVPDGLAADSWTGILDNDATFKDGTGVLFQLSGAEVFSQKKGGVEVNKFLVNKKNASVVIQKLPDGKWHIDKASFDNANLYRRKVELWTGTALPNDTIPLNQSMSNFDDVVIEADIVSAPEAGEGLTAEIFSVKSLLAATRGIIYRATGSGSQVSQYINLGVDNISEAQMDVYLDANVYTGNITAVYGIKY